MVHARFETDHGKGLFGTHWALGNLRNERDVFLGCQARDQIVELKHEPHMASAIGRQPSVIQPGEFQISEKKLTARRMIEPAHDVQQRRFSTAGWTKQNDHLSSEDFQVDRPQGVDRHLAGRVGLCQGSCAEDRVSHRVLTSRGLIGRVRVISPERSTSSLHSERLRPPECRAP